MSFKPSVSFLSQISTSRAKMQLVDQVMKEFEIFNYFSERVPLYLGDEHWERLLNMKTVFERVQYWDFTALTQNREKLDQKKKMLKKEKVEERSNVGRELFNAGGMAYGTNFYRLLLNPYRVHKAMDTNMFSKMVSNYFINDLPKVLLDVQYVQNTMKERQASLLGDQVEKLAEAHFYYGKQPLPLEFINAGQTRNEFFKRIGFCSRKDDRINNLLPEIHPNNPYISHMKNSSSVKEEDQIIYLSRHATKILDGPLIHKAYVIPITFDRDKESLGICRTNRFRAMSLPIDKYVKWQSGTKAIPFINIFKILTDVNNGCTWKRALHNNIARRHLVPHEEQIKVMGVHQHKHRERRENIFKLVKMIESAIQNPTITNSSL